MENTNLKKKHVSKLDAHFFSFTTFSYLVCLAMLSMFISDCCFSCSTTFSWVLKWTIIYTIFFEWIAVMYSLSFLLCVWITAHLKHHLDDSCHIKKLPLLFMCAIIYMVVSLFLADMLYIFMYSLISMAQCCKFIWYVSLFLVWHQLNT